MDPITIAFFAAPAMAALFVVLLGIKVVFLRRVVSTNEVHIVQSSKKTTSYGKDTGNGNTYYEWPSWLPLFGVTKIVLPVSVFDLDLVAYEAYDKGRLPFVVDVKAFFRILDSNVAAQRVASFEELMNQLRAVVQGAIRVILASNDIEEILQGRSKFGDDFTKEVDHQLTNWGVSTVKNIELMDLRDGKDSHVIKSIMEKKKSHIDMESRTEVAKNTKLAQIAEIEAKREVELQAQEAKQTVGLRTIEAERQVELQSEAKSQAVREQARLTKEKEMAIVQVELTRKAEIEKGVQIVKTQQLLETAEIEKGVHIVRAQQDQATALLKAEADQRTSVLRAQGQKETLVLTSEGTLEAKRREAEGISLEGQAKAAATQAMQRASVESQIALAKEIGENEPYQKYLITIRQVEANQAIGIEQAKAIAQAEIKVIANTGNVPEALNGVTELLSSKGGTRIGAMLEGLAQTEKGQELLDLVTTKLKPTPTTNGNGKTA